MRKIISFVLCTLVLCTVLSSCRRQPKEVCGVTTEAVAVDASADTLQDKSYLTHLAPVKASLEQEMNVRIGYAPVRMWVGAPECPMLNWASDALWEAAKRVYDGRVDVAVVNMGGMRCEWAEGPVTRSCVFELMPFDNRLVVLTLKGSDLLDLCRSFVTYGGQGVAGMRVQARNGRLASVTVAGRPVKPEALYTVATSDYLSGGADHMDALTRYADCWNSDLLIRDLYLQAVMEQDTVRAAVDGRMDL